MKVEKVGNKVINPIDETHLVDKGLPKAWTCPHCKRRNIMGPYKEEELLQFFKTMQHCDFCGYVHLWTLELTEEFKRKTIEMLTKGGKV